jgi:hypothetical protein
MKKWLEHFTAAIFFLASNSVLSGDRNPNMTRAGGVRTCRCSWRDLTLFEVEIVKYWFAFC